MKYILALCLLVIMVVGVGCSHVEIKDKYGVVATCGYVEDIVLKDYDGESGTYWHSKLQIGDILCPDIILKTPDSIDKGFAYCLINRGQLPLNMRNWYELVRADEFKK